MRPSLADPPTGGGKPPAIVKSARRSLDGAKQGAGDPAGPPGGPSGMSSFGQYLRDRGAIDAEQFDDVCRSQIVHGGRIGSSLVELGYLRLEQLAEYLSDYHDVPRPPEAWLEAPDERALKLVPSSLIRRYNVLPLRLEPDQIHVAMLDPKDRSQIDLIGDAARRAVKPYVLPEVRLRYWLEIHCGIDPHPRYKNLAARARQSESGPVESAAHFAPLAEGEELSSELLFATTAEATPLADRAEAGSARKESIDESLLEEIVLVEEVPADLASPFSAASPATSPRLPTGPGEISALEALLQGADDRDEIIDLGLRLGAAFAPAVALFIVRNQLVTGHRALAFGIASRLDTILLPADMPSIFTQPAVTNHAFRGRPPHDGMDGRVLEAIGRSDAQEVLIQPVSIQGRVVNLLYADNGADALADTLVAALRTLAETMGAAYERLILEAKRSE